MSRRVLDVGNCGPDHYAISQLLQEHFDVTVVQAHGMRDAMSLLRQGAFDLVIVNRVMDRDGTYGIDIIQAIKADSNLADLPVMLISNFENHQTQAQQAGAIPGFGKSALYSPETVDIFRPYLE
jgi:CheY-like chemotaxis protein